MKIKFILLIGLVAFVAAAALYPSEKAKSKPFHTKSELAFFKQHTRSPIDSNEYFLNSSHCKGCHGHDPTGLANVNENGDDVNLFDDWETSMMGFAAIDPYWRAKVSHESMLNPNIANDIQTTCTSCHAPMGHYTAIYHGANSYTIADLVDDSLGRDGVSCVGCHAIGNDGLGAMFSGNIPFDTTHVLYGPFTTPFQGPMILYVGMTPTFSYHVSEGNFCSPCHTLQTKTVDLDGNYTGGTFTEQATYHEWINSNFPSLGLSCQSCHMPQIEDPVVIANGYANLQGRTPFNQHQFAGGNSFMVNLIRQNKIQLGVTASEAQFDSTISATLKLLQQQSIDLTLTTDTIFNDTARFNLKLLNKAGHKFPSGYPSRRAVVQFVVLKENGDTLFASGMFDGEYKVVSENISFEPHYDVINSPTKPQIYEMVMADVNGDRTTSLERAADFLKDNRIPPAGFSSTHSVYDTVKVVGVNNDSNFNQLNGNEGSGTDEIQYRVALNGYQGDVNVFASVYYQSVPPKWLEEMFLLNSAEIDTFRNMYDNADKTPVLIAQDTLQNVEVWNSTKSFSNSALEIIVSPNPTSNGLVNISISNHQNIESVEIVSANGKKIPLRIKRLGSDVEVVLPQASGIYYARVKTTDRTFTAKLLRL